MRNGTETGEQEALPAKQAQEAIAISSRLPIDEGLPVDVLDVLPGAVYVCDSAGRVVRCNQRAVELWGRAPKLGSMDERFCGSWRLYRMDGGPLPHDQCPMAEVLRHGRPVRDQEVMIERPDGSRITALLNIVALRDASGALVGAVNMFVDITERKVAETAFYEQEAQFRNIVESSNDAIITKTLGGIIKSWNRGAEQLFGYLADEAIGKPITIIIPPDRLNEETMIIERLTRGERIDHYDTVRQRKDGRLIFISLTVSPIRDSKGTITGASKIARDITERREAEEKTKLLTREVNHRANNLLTLLNAMMRQTRADTIPAFVAAMEGRISALARVQTRLARDHWNRTDLLTLIREELAPFDQRDAPRVQIAGPSVPLNAGDAQAFAIVIHELATNAAKYGALSVSSGNVAINWSLMPEGQLVLIWSERGGPTVSRPDRQGFGTRAISILADQLDGTIEVDWRREGLACRLSIPANLHGERAAIP